MTSVLRSLLNTMASSTNGPERSEQDAPHRTAVSRIYKQFNILTQYDKGMQKAAGACVGNREDPAVRVEHPEKGGCHLFLRKKVTATFFEVGGGEGVAMSGAAGPLRGQGDGGHVGEEGVHRDDRR